MEILLVTVVSLLLAILNQLHVITQWIQNPPERLFTGIAHYYADYFLYTDLMAQGASGSLWTAAHFTNEPMAKTWIYWFNALLGFVGSRFGLNPFATYNVSLFVLVVALCLLWYHLVKLLYPANRFLRLTAWLMILTASSFSANGQLLGQFWFSPTPAFNRLGGVPHQVFQTIVFIFLAIVSTQKGLRILPLMLLAILAASANPVQMVLFLAAALSLRSPRVILLALGSFPVMYATNKAFELPVLAAARRWENAQLVSVPLWQFILSVGPVALLVPFGVKSFLKERTPLRLLLFSYGAASLVAFFSPIPKLLGTTSVRWLHPAAYGLLGILAAEGLRKRVPLFVLFVLLTIPSLLVQIDARVNPAKNPILTADLNHVPMTVVEKLIALKQSGVRGVVLTDPILPYDVLVPTITGFPSFTGHPIHTLYPDVKEKLRRDFFEGRMSSEQKKQFLSDHRITAIYE